VIPYLSPEFITALMEIFEPKQVTNKYLSNEAALSILEGKWKIVVARSSTAWHQGHDR
jgi:hypothetical protein